MLNILPIVLVQRHILEKQHVQLTVNGGTCEVAVKPNMSLLDFIRDELGLTGTKRGCDTGECGKCTVLVDGEAVSSCQMLVIEANGKDILTIEGLAKGAELNSFVRR